MVGALSPRADSQATPGGGANAAEAAGRRAGRLAAIAGAAERLRPWLIEQRRDFHRHPELSNREERTARVVAEQLRAAGLEEVRTGVAKHGVVALLRGARPGAVVAARADLDALPIQETLDVPYKSLNPGVKHACGHDVHTAVQLGVARVLSQMRDRIPGTVKFLFQPAEEGAPLGEDGGAAYMIAQGALADPQPGAIFGLHVAPDLDVGQIGYSLGPALASADRFLVTIRGRMSHGAWPQDGIDAIVVAAECIGALQTLRSRRIDTREPFVLSIGKIQGGTRSNIIADEVTLDGTVRTHSEAVRAQVKELMREVLDGVTAAHGARFTLDYRDGNPVTFNPPELVQATLPALRQVVGQAQVIERKPVMGAEDFAFYQQVVPGFFYFLGVRNTAKGITAMIHTAEFDVDEECLVVGVQAMANVLLDYLERAAASP
ncbi:MAG: amidohydrolase [Verrucomicrobia bacterium]|nr:amidohydrolase [Verrucomicrobiota bacterium]